MSAPKPDKLNRIVNLLMTRVMTKEYTLGYDEQVPHNNQIQEEISPHCNKHKKSESSSMYDDDEAPEDGDSKSIDAHNFKEENKSNSSASDLSCLSVIAKQPNSPKGKTLHKCKYCTKVFSRKSDNIKHERVHTGERPFLCRVCKKAFTQKAACVRHERLHNYDRPFICQFCGNGFIQRWDLVLHERIHTGEKLFDCHFCKMIFTQKKTLERHERIHTNERPFQCHYCGQGFTQSSTLVKHERIHTGEKPYTCKYCGRKFASNSDCGRHERIHARKVQNKQSNLSSLPDIQANAVNTVVGQNNGDAKQDKNFPKSFIKSTAEMTSVVKQVNPGDVVEKRETSNFCEIHAETGHRIQEGHFQATADNGLIVNSTDTCLKPVQNIVKFQDGNFSLTADNGHASVSSKNYIEVDLHIAQREHPIVADKSSFQTNTSVKQTTIGVDTESKKDVFLITENENCCNKLESGSPVILGEAQKVPTSKHQERPKNDKLYKCEFCGKAFAHRCDSIRHIRIHTGEKPFKCSVCEKAFSDRSSCVKHEKIHTLNKPFTCQYCGNGFVQRMDLVFHERLHTGEKPFACHFCKMTFTQKKICARHERIHTNDKPFQCHFCGQAFTQSSTLVKHERIHTGEKPYTCKSCGKKFARKSDCGRHEKIHGGKNVK